jgi:hypothetical protein
MWQCPKCKREFKNKNQNHICTEILTIDAYIVAQDQAIQPILHKIRKVIRAQAPLAKRKFNTFCSSKKSYRYISWSRGNSCFYRSPDLL